ncbi:MAG: transcriptional regulator [Trueperaceae bacterium]|nr:transcriptional regulator [Trueperaceae bacterium]
MSMESSGTVRFAERRLLVVIAESVLEERLLADLRHWGVGGLSSSRVEGDPFGSRVGDIAGAFVRFECVVGADVAERALSGLARSYFPRFKVVAYDHAVRVVRPDKYG